MKFPEIDSPFAMFEGGSGYVLPNELPSMAHDALQRLEREPADDVLPSLLQSGRTSLVHGMQAQDVHNVWNFFIWYYLTPTGDDTPSIAVRTKLLDLMLSGPMNAAWQSLRSYILENIDDLSGWSRSFRKEIAERDQIWRGEDGSYYQKDADGEVCHVVGAKTLDEARLDFLTEQIVQEFGNIRLFLKFFSWLAISQDFGDQPQAYHASLKAIVQDRQWPSLNHRWSLLQWNTPRTFVWRPPSNLCDPQWLAGDLLASITDTLSVKPYQPLSVPTPIGSELGPEYIRQADFALETSLRIGHEEATIVQFGGREFRWINASLESETRVSLGLKANEDGSLAGEELNRLLSVLVWQHGVPISKRSGPVIGVKRALPLISSARSVFSFNVNAANPVWMQLDSLGQDEKLVLSMFREAVNSRSVFYAFLNYWKIIERLFSKQKPRYDWVDQAALRLKFDPERERVAEIAKTHARISEYLDSNCRNAVVHVFSEPYIDPDSSEDFVRLSLDLPVVKSLAKLAIKTLPAFAS